MPESKKKHPVYRYITLFFWLSVAIFALLGCYISLYRYQYREKIYPNVRVGNVPFGGKSKTAIIDYWDKKNALFSDAQFTLKFQSTTATLSAQILELGYDANLSATQAYLVGRSGKWLSDLYVTFIQKNVDLDPYFRWNETVLNDAVDELASQIDIPVQDALFRFEGGKVTEFKTSTPGQKLDQEEAKQRMQEAFRAIAKTGEKQLTIILPVNTVTPSIETNDSNTFGIRERIGSGYSEFAGSIPGRIHNVALAASRLNGVLIKPDEEFSFNRAVGDISAATGYQSAYIIKDGRTILGDGGGVCQVSSTLFRAALNAGLPIVERHAHAYRVHYYEEGGFKPGMDATVFSPSVDLRIKNDTGNSILIQTNTDTKNLTLTFELYGTKDGRVAQVYDHIVWDQTSAPPPLYQDDPTLAPGVVKQVDWAASGAKASFKYKVTRGNEILQDTLFYSFFRPWQAVYLKGPSV